MYAATSTPILCTRSPRACTNAALTARLLWPWPLLWAALAEFDWGTWEWGWEWAWEWRWPDWFSKKPILKVKEEKHSKKQALGFGGWVFLLLFFFPFKPKNWKRNAQYHFLTYLWKWRGPAKLHPMRKLQAMNELAAYSEIHLWVVTERKADLTLS